MDNVAHRWGAESAESAESAEDMFLRHVMHKIWFNPHNEFKTVPVGQYADEDDAHRSLHLATMSCDWGRTALLGAITIRSLEGSKWPPNICVTFPKPLVITYLPLVVTCVVLKGDFLTLTFTTKEHSCPEVRKFRFSVVVGNGAYLDLKCME
jgi:hypothetical protein